jgi:hypothetical protein
MWARVDPLPARAIADAGHGWGNRVKDRISRRTLTSKLTRHPDWNAVNTTAPMPPPTPGPGPSTPPARCSPRWPSIAPRPISTKHPTRRNPLPPKSGPGSPGVTRLSDSRRPAGMAAVRTATASYKGRGFPLDIVNHCPAATECACNGSRFIEVSPEITRNNLRTRLSRVSSTYGTPY